jgi:hypothetical protein
MARYDDVEITGTVTYGDLSLTLTCLSRQRKELHDRADYAESAEAPNIPPDQVRALRRKASAIYDLMQRVEGVLADARREFALTAPAGDR